MRQVYQYIALFLASYMLVWAAPIPEQPLPKRSLEYLHDTGKKGRVLLSPPPPPPPPADPYHTRHSQIRRHRPFRGSPSSSLHEWTQTSSSDHTLPEEDVLEIDRIKDGSMARGIWGMIWEILGGQHFNLLSSKRGKGKVQKINAKRPAKPKPPKEVRVIAVDWLGRKIVQRGTEVFIEEPIVAGSHWRGAEELDDDTDEPVSEE